jgi:hypothetical protein
VAWVWIAGLPSDSGWLSPPAAVVAPSEPVEPVPAKIQPIEAKERPAISESEIRVTADLVNLRAGGHAVVGQIKRGDVLQLLEQRSEWLHVRLGELDAWMHATLAEDVSMPGLRRVREPNITPLYRE